MSYSDWEELDPPGSRLAGRLADSVVDAVRRRRRALIWAAGALALPALLVVGVVMLSGGRDRPVSGAAAKPSDVRADVYLAAIAAEPKDVYLPAALPEPTRSAIERATGARVHFGPPPSATQQSPVVVLGVVRVRGAHAEVQRDYLCGPLCGSGWTVQLDRRDGSWKVTGRSGPAWVS